MVASNCSIPALCLRADAGTACFQRQSVLAELISIIRVVFDHCSWACMWPWQLRPQSQLLVHTRMDVLRTSVCWSRMALLRIAKFGASTVSCWMLLQACVGEVKDTNCPDVSVSPQILTFECLSRHLKTQDDPHEIALIILSIKPSEVPAAAILRSPILKLSHGFRYEAKAQEHLELCIVPL